MSASNRLLDSALRIIGLVVALSLAVLLVPLALQESSRTPEERAARAEQARREAEDANSLALTCARIDPAEDSPAARRCEHARDQADLNAQEGMRAAAWVQAVVSALSFIGLVFTVIFAAGAYREARRAAIAGVRAARQARRQADIAEVALRESRQPALYVNAESWKIEIPSVPVVNVRIQNLGNNLAVVTGGRVLLCFGMPRILSKKEINSGNFGQASYVTVGTRALGAGKWFTVEVGCLTLGTFEQAKKAFELMTRRHDSPTFYCVGWAEYRDQWGNEYEEPIALLFHPASPPLKAYWSALNIRELQEG